MKYILVVLFCTLLVLVAISARGNSKGAKSETSDFMKPIKGREGYVGGIESLMIDGQRYFFGFSPKSDVVVSPLIPDIENMSKFASAYMEQTDGKHDEKYWRELAELSITYESETGYSHSDMTIDTKKLKEFVAGLDRIIAGEPYDNDLGIKNSLIYFLPSVVFWDEKILEDRRLISLSEKLEIDLSEVYWESIDLAIKVLNAREGSKTKSDRKSAAMFLRRIFSEVVKSAPNNWGQKFEILIVNEST